MGVDDIIRRHYPELGAAGCVPFMPEGWDREKVRNRARRLKLKAPWAAQPWTCEEIDEVSVAMAAGDWTLALPNLPHRSRESIRQQMLKLRKAPVMSDGLPAQPFASLHRAWQSIDRTIPAANDGPLIARIAS